MPRTPIEIIDYYISQLEKTKFLSEAQSDQQRRASIDTNIQLLTQLRIDFELEYRESQEKIYPDLASAQEALDRGTTVRIAMELFPIDPALLRLAQELQDKDRLRQWLHQEKHKTE